MQLLVRILPVLALAVPLAMVSLAAWLNWGAAWREATAELRHSADALAEYTARDLSGFVVLIGRMNDLLRGLNDEGIRAGEAELHAQLAAVMRQLPRAEASYVTDRNGFPLVSGNIYPVPGDQPFAADRDFFLALSGPNPPPVHISQQYVSRIDNLPFFAVSRRREGAGNQALPNDFAGLINISLRPGPLGEAMRTLLVPDDVGALVRTDGLIVARTRLLPVSQQASGTLQGIMAQGQRSAAYMDRSTVENRQALVAVRQVDGFPLYVAASRPRVAIVAAWQRSVVAHLWFGVPATLALFLLSLMARNTHVRVMRSNASLEERVDQRTVALAASEARFRATFEQAAIGMAHVGLDGRWLRVNDRLCAMTGFSEEKLLAVRVHDIVHPDNLADDEAQMQRLLDHEIASYATERRYLRADGSSFWILLTVSLLHDLAGKPRHFILAIDDIAERKRAEAHNALLMREVDHRAKNALAVVLAALRLSKADTQADYVKAVEGRVAALARAHTVLAERRWEGAGLRELLRGELEPFLAHGGDPHAELNGPAVTLAADATQALCLVLHELATNAMKYGALSTRGGLVNVTWWLEADRLHLCWQESGGPPTLAPTHRGFGSRVIEQTVQSQLGGRLERQWRATGLVCEIEVPHGAGATRHAPAEASVVAA